MTQVLISYLLRRITKVANIDPSDISSSLFYGTIELKRVAISEEILKKIPIDLSVEVIPYVFIKLPTPASISSPICVTISGVHVKIPLHALQKSTENGSTLGEAFTENMFNLEEEYDEHRHRRSSLSDSDYMCKRTRQEERELLGESISSEYEEDEGVEIQSLASSGTFSLEDADLASCRSDADSDLMKASSSLNEVPYPPESEQNSSHQSGSIFSFLKKKLQNSMERIMDRRFEITLENTQVEIIVDERLKVSCVGSIRSASLVVEPTSTVHTEWMRPMKMTIVDSFITAVFDQQQARILEIGNLETNLALANMKGGTAPVRLNSSVKINEIIVGLDVSNASVLAKCVEPVRNILLIPPFCRHHFHLRKLPSRWPYVLRCVQSYLEDVRKRYNFNSSHIRFYCNSRRRYLRLLGECYQDCSIGRRRSDLDELESDIRFPDVIFFLRQLQQEKYGISRTLAHFPTSESSRRDSFQSLSSRDLFSASRGKFEANSQDLERKCLTPGQTSSQSLLFTHVHVLSVRLHLPHKSALVVQEVRVASRKDEFSLQISQLAFMKGDSSLCYVKAAHAEDEILLKVDRCTSGPHDEIKVEFQPIEIHLPLIVVQETIRPLLDIIVLYNVLEVVNTMPFLKSKSKHEEVLAEIPSIAATGGGRFFLRNHFQAIKSHRFPLSPSTSLSLMEAKKIKTVFIVVPSLSVKVENFLVALKKASFVIQKNNEQRYPQFGVNIQELSVACGDHETSLSSPPLSTNLFLLFPITVHMASDDSIYCSSTQIAISTHIFQSIQSVCTNVMMIIPEEILLFWRKPRISSTPTLVGHPTIFSSSLSELSRVCTRCWKKPKAAQTIVVEELVVSFDPLDIVARSGELKAFPVVLDSSITPGNKSTECLCCSTMTAEEKIMWDAQALSGYGWSVAVGNINVSVGDKEGFYIVLHAGNTSKTSSFENSTGTSFSIPEIQHNDAKGNAPADSRKGSSFEGICFFFLPSQLTCVDIYNITLTQHSPAFSSPFQLTSLSRLTVRIKGQDVVMKVKEATVLQGFFIKNFWLAVRGEPLAYHDRPYIASTISIQSQIVEIDLTKIGKFVWDPLLLLVTHIDSVFAGGILVPKQTYNTFYSGFSHVLISVDVKECPLILSDTAKLIVTLEHHPLAPGENDGGFPSQYLQKGVSGLLLSSFSTFCSGVEIFNSPFVVFSDVKVLGQHFTLGHLKLSLTAPSEVTQAKVEIDIYGLTIQFPIGKLEVWNKKILSITPPTLSVTLSKVELLIPVKLETEESIKDHEYSVIEGMLHGFFLEKVSEGTIPTSRKSGAILPSTSSSSLQRRGSSACSSLSLDDHASLCHRAVVDGALISVHAEHPLEVYRDLIVLGEQFLGIPFIFTHHTIICAAVSRQAFVMEETGDIFFDCGNEKDQIIVVEFCTFRSSVTHRCIVVADGTTVVFRNCVFQHRDENFLRGSGQSSFFVCENCTDTLLKSETANSHSSAGSHQKIQVELKRTNLQVHLMDNTVYRVINQVVEFVLTSKPSLIYFSLNIHDGQVNVTDEGVDTIVSSDMAVKAEVSFKPKKKALATNVNVSLGEVAIPILSHVFPQLMQIFSLRLKCPPQRRYVVPRPLSKDLSRFPLDEWKVLLSVSVVPINIVLRSSCTIAKFHLSNGYIWSTFSAQARPQATIEGHFGFSNLSLLDFGLRSFRRITSVPLDINVTGEATDMSNISTDIKVSLGEVMCTPNQLRLLTTLMQHSTELNTTSIRVVNHTGEEVEIGEEGSTINLVVEAGAVKEGQMKNYPFDKSAETVIRIGNLKVKSEEPFCGPIAIYGFDDVVSFSTSKLVPEGGVNHVLVKTITNRFVREIQIFTVLHVKNETNYPLRFTSMETSTKNVEIFEILPNSLSCIPTSMMSANNVKMSVLWQGYESAGVSLWEHGSILEFIDAAQLHHPAPSVKALCFANYPQEQSPTFYVLTSYELSWKSALFLFVTCAQPKIQSNVLFPIQLQILKTNSREIVRKEALTPGSDVQLYDINPEHSHELVLRMIAGDLIFQSQESLMLTDPTSEHRIGMRSLSSPTAQESFELHAVPFQNEGTRVRGFILQASRLCYIENRCNKRIQFLYQEGEHVGTTGSSGIPLFVSPSDPVGTSGAYIPLRVPILLKFEDTQNSGPFEITGRNEGSVVECPFEEDFDGVTCVALLRPVPCDFFVSMEILPPILLKNKGLNSAIHVRHEVHREGIEKCVFSRISCVPAGSDLCVPYFALAAEGCINYFSFSKEPSLNQFSHRIEANLAPGTSWTGQLEFGSSTHRVSISKTGPYDPAILTVGAPQDIGFQLINFTSADFTEVAPMAIRRWASSVPMVDENEALYAERTRAWDQGILVLSRSNGTRYRVRVAEDNVQEVEPDLFMYTIIGEEMVTVVVCGWNLNNGEISRKITRIWPTIIGSVAFSSTSFTVHHENSSVLQISIQGINSLITASRSYSLQASLSGFSISTRRDGKVIYVVEPVELSASLRDAKTSSFATSIQSFHLTVTPVVIIISDYFIGKLLPVLHVCTNYSKTSFRRQWESKQLLRFSSQQERAVPPKRIYIENAVLSPIALEVTWDRSVSSRSGLQGILPWWASVIPSLHHASLLAPQVELRQVSRDSAALLISNIRSLYLKEIIKQIPKFIGSVGLFQKNTSILHHIASKVSSLFSSSSDDSEIAEGSARLM